MVNKTNLTQKEVEHGKKAFRDSCAFFALITHEEAKDFIQCLQSYCDNFL